MDVYLGAIITVGISQGFDVGLPFLSILSCTLCLQLSPCVVIFQVILTLLCLLNVKPTFPTWLESSPNGSTEHNKCLIS